MAQKDMTINVLGRDVSGSKVLKDVGAQADKTADRLDNLAKISIKSMAGVSAGALGAGAAVAGGLAVASGAFIAMTAVALKGNAEVVDSWTNLTDHVKGGVREMAAPLEGRMVAAAGQLQDTFDSLDLDEGFVAAGPAIDHLVSGIDTFARRAVPGMVHAMKSSEPVFVGVRGALGDLGDGVDDFFVTTSAAAPAAGKIIDDFGDIARDALGGTGDLLADLANNGVGTVDQLAQVFGHLMGTVTSLAGSGMPALFGTASTVLGVMDKILQVVGPLAPVLGNVVGVMLSAKAGAAIFGAAGDALGRWGEKATAAGASGGKAAGAVGRLGGALGAIGPWGAVAGATLLGVSAAADAAFGSADQLTAALMTGGNAAEKASEQLSHNDFVVGLLGQNAKDTSGLMSLFVTTTEDANRAVSEQRAQMTSLERAQMDAAKAAADHQLAVEKYGPASDQAAAAAAILVVKQRELRGAQDDAAQATKSLTEKLLAQQDAVLALANENLALRMAQRQYEDAVKATKDAMSEYGAKSTEVHDAMLNQESAALRLIEAAKSEALSHYANRDGADAQTASLNAANAKALELAASMQGPLPAALAITIANMDDASLSALGATRSIDETNTTVINLKDGKTIKIEANDQATPVLHGIQRTVDGMRGKQLDIIIRQLISTAPADRQADLGNPLKVLGPNDGGLIPGSGPDRDSVPAVLTPGEFVVKRTATRRWLPLLERINSEAGGDAVMAALGMAQFDPGRGGAGFTGAGGFGGFPAQVPEQRIVWEIRSGGARLDDLIVEILQRSVKDRGGDVQAVLGGGR